MSRNLAWLTDASVRTQERGFSDCIQRREVPFWRWEQQTISHDIGLGRPRHAGGPVGLDSPKVRNTPVEAANDGKVVYAGPLGIYGNCTVVDHGYGLQSIYVHLNRIGVKPADSVNCGATMGLTDSTGLAAGDHLHFGMQADGVQVNPLEWWDNHWIEDHIWNKLLPPPPAK